MLKSTFINKFFWFQKFKFQEKFENSKQNEKKKRLRKNSSILSKTMFNLTNQ